MMTHFLRSGVMPQDTQAESVHCPPLTFAIDTMTPAGDINRPTRKNLRNPSAHVASHLPKSEPPQECQCRQRRTPRLATEKVRMEEPRKLTGTAHVHQDAASYSADKSAAPAVRAGDADDAGHMLRRRSAAPKHPAHPERYDYRRHGTGMLPDREPL